MNFSRIVKLKHINDEFRYSDDAEILFAKLISELTMYAIDKKHIYRYKNKNGIDAMSYSKQYNMLIINFHDFMRVFESKYNMDTHEITQLIQHFFKTHLNLSGFEISYY